MNERGEPFAGGDLPLADRCVQTSFGRRSPRGLGLSGRAHRFDKGLVIAGGVGAITIFEGRYASEDRFVRCVICGGSRGLAGFIDAALGYEVVDV
jgi:hypothetical protein